MTFNNPNAFYCALLAIPIIACYLLRVRVRRIPVSTLMFWDDVVQERQPRSLWRRFRHLASLLAQLTLLALMTIALADPVSTSGSQPRRVVAVVDCSASTTAVRADGKTQFDDIRRQLEQLVDSLRPWDQMAIVVARSQPQVASGMTSLRRQLRRASERLTVTEGAVSLEEAVFLAERMVQGEENAEIFVLTDGCDGAVTGKEGVTIVAPSESLPNTAITLFQARQHPADPAGYQLLSEVCNFSNTSVTCELEILRNDALLDVVPFQLAAGEKKTHVINDESASGAILQGRLTGLTRQQNALTADDVAWAVVPARRKLRVTLVTDGNWFLEKAIQAIPIADTTTSGQMVENADQRPDVLVLDRFNDSTVPAGAVLVISPRSSTDLWQLEGTITDVLPGWKDSEHPVLQHVRLDDIVIPRGRKIVPVGPHQVLVESASGDPLLVLYPRDSGDVIVLTADPEQGDFPLRTAFPILLSNILRWFSGADGDFLPAVSAGHAGWIALPRSSRVRWQPGTVLTLQGPRGVRSKATWQNGQLVVSPLEYVGLWRVTSDPQPDASQPAELQIACNLTDAAESRLQPADALPDGTAESSVYSFNGGGRPPWFYLTLGTVLLMLSEWCLYQRRWIT